MICFTAPIDIDDILATNIAVMMLMLTLLPVVPLHVLSLAGTGTILWYPSTTTAGTASARSVASS